MAKITLLPEIRQAEDVRIYLLGLMKVKGITHEQMADYLGITRKTLANRMTSGTLTLIDLLLMFDKLEIGQDKRSELLTMQGEET